MPTPAFTPPTTWATGDVPTAAQLNAQLRDNVLSTATPSLLYATRAAVQSIPTGVFTDVLWTVETIKTDTGMHDTVTNPNRLIVPANLGGVWEVTASLQFTAMASGFATYVAFAKNGGGSLNADWAPTLAGLNPAVCGTAPFLLVAGDYVTVQAWQNSGAANNLIATSFVYFRRVSN